MKRLLSIILTIMAVACSRQPESLCPVIPMTAITGSPDRAAVRDLLRRYDEVGIEQFLIYPRSGLEIEYMSDGWFRFCRDCLEIADSLGMKVWLYDEYNLPSGSCKGAVTADGHEDCYPKVLLFDKGEDGEYSISVKTNAVGADILDPEAVARFIALTHERYYSEFKEYFGRVIPAIFTDEPSFCYSMNSPSGLLEAIFTRFDSDHFALTWYDGLEGDYKAACGGDLRADVIAYLHGEPSGKLWTEYYTLLGGRMRKTYIESLAGWCRDHGVQLTGHLNYEKFYKSVRCNGNILKALSCFGIPGFDEANSDIALNAREMEISGLALTQYARRGKPGAMCELYSVGPADNPMSIMRQLMWMCAAFGIDNYIVAVSAMDARGNKEKGDWYFPSGPTQPWFDYYKEFCADAGRAASFARKDYRPDVLVRVPSRYFMSLDKTPAFEREGLKYLRFLEHLLSWQLQFQLLDEDEDAGSLPVLTFGPEGFSIEGEDASWTDLETYFSHVAMVVDRSIVVYDDCGAEVRYLLVRLWSDGSFTLVDLTDEDGLDRIVTVRSGLREARVRIQGHGAFAGTFREARKQFASLAHASRLDFDGASIVPQSTNLVRCTFRRDDPQFRFSVADSISGARIHLRSMTAPSKAFLDGVEVLVDQPSDRLPFGFANLYLSSGEMTLGPGEHCLRFAPASEESAEVVDYRYLPGAFIEGSFCYSRGTRTLSCKPQADALTSYSSIPDYVGTYDIVKQFDGLPESLSLDTNLACTELLVDGVSLGRRAWAPYEWEIPGTMRSGIHEVTVRISTSVMPMFGDVSLLDEDQPYIGWLRIKPGHHGDKTVTGIF